MSDDAEVLPCKHRNSFQLSTLNENTAGLSWHAFSRDVMASSILCSLLLDFMSSPSAAC